MRGTRVVLIVLAGFFGLPAVGMDVLRPVGVFTEPQTGMVYPEAVGDFQRINVIKYAPDGSDESVGYNLIAPHSEVSSTVYFFPSPSLRSVGSPPEVIEDARASLCLRQFLAIEQEILRAHPDAHLLKEEQVTLDQMGKTFRGHKVTYQLMIEKFFGRRQATHSEAYLFCYAGGRWSVEYRIDYPAEYDASGPIAALLRDFKWTMKPE